MPLHSLHLLLSLCLVAALISLSSQSHLEQWLQRPSSLGAQRCEMLLDERRMHAMRQPPNNVTVCEPPPDTIDSSKIQCFGATRLQNEREQAAHLCYATEVLVDLEQLARRDKRGVRVTCYPPEREPKIDLIDCLPFNRWATVPPSMLVCVRWKPALALTTDRPARPLALLQHEARVIEERLTLFIRRDGSSNLFHCINDHVMAFQTLEVLGVTHDDVQVILIDDDKDHRKVGLYEQLWRVVTRHPVLYWMQAIEHYGSPQVCIRFLPQRE